MSALITSEETNVRNLDSASIRVDWTGTPIGILTVQALQEKDSDPKAETDLLWFDLDLGAEIAIDAVNTDHQIIFTSLPFDRIRLVYTPTSGSGVLNAKITAWQVGG